LSHSELVEGGDTGRKCGATKCGFEKNGREVLPLAIYILLCFGSLDVPIYIYAHSGTQFRYVNVFLCFRGLGKSSPCGGAKFTAAIRGIATGHTRPSKSSIDFNAMNFTTPATSRALFTKDVQIHFSKPARTRMRQSSQFWHHCSIRSIKESRNVYWASLKHAFQCDAH
jgi:hypothetical protein